MAASLFDTARFDSGFLFDAVGSGVGTPRIELLLGGVWTDITSYVRTQPGIQIRRGRQDWSQTPTYATCNLTLDNRDGRFSPRNASGAYYGNIGRNTQIRVSVLKDDGTYTIRFWGDVTAWPVSWEESGRNVWVDIEASGLRRRLTQGAIPLRSPMRRTLQAYSMAAYWPLEDGSATTSFGSALPTGYPMNIGGSSVIGAASTEFAAGSGDLPTLVGVGASLTGLVRPYAISPGGGQHVAMLIEVDSSTAAQGVDIVVTFANGGYIVVEYLPATNTIEAKYFPPAGGASTTTGVLAAGSPTLSSPAILSIFTLQIGADLNFGVDYGSTTGDNFVENSALAVGATESRISAVKVLNVGTPGGTDITTVLGHVFVETPDTDISRFAVFSGGLWYSAPLGFAGEPADYRASRLCTEEVVSVNVTGAHTGNACSKLGPQPQDTFLGALDQCAFVDGGLSTETVTTRALQFRALSDMFDQTPVMNINYTAGNTTGLTPVDDDQFTANDITATRTNGGSANYQVTTGNLAISAIGDYAESVDLNVYLDDQLPYQAQWRAAVGTVDAPRWPVVAFNAVSTLSGGQRPQLVTMREGDLLILSNLPSYSGASASTIYVQVLGWSETITDHSWDFVVNAFPADLIRTMFILNDATYGILDTDRLGVT